MAKQVVDTQAQIRNAVLCLQRGDHEEARRICHKIIDQNPKSVDAIQLMGTIMLQRQQFNKAIDFFDQALVLNDQQELIWSNRALALSNVGKLDNALESVNKALEINSQFPQAIFNKANILFKLKKFSECVIFFQQYSQLRPNEVGAYHLAAFAYREINDPISAIRCYEEVIQLKPDFLEAIHNLGLLLCDQGEYEKCISYCDQALSINPNFWEALQNKGVAFDRIGDLASAAECFKQAIKINPTAKQCLVNGGIVLQKMDYLDESLTYLSKAIDLDKNYAEAFFNRGYTNERLQKLDDAVFDYDKAISLEPNKEGSAALNATWNKSLVQLCKGDYENGWRSYEVRKKLEGERIFYDKQELTNFYWNGDPAVIRGKVLLIHTEQGLGDTIQFCRYIKILANMGATIIFKVQKPLVNLLRNLQGVASLIADDEPVPAFDFFCHLMSLPYLLNTTQSSIPCDIPYITADLDKVNLWSKRLGEKTKKRVGLVWSGGFKAEKPSLWLLNKRRNIDLILLKNLKNENIEFHSLQKGELPEAELVVLHLENWEGPNIINHAEYLNDFTDTAALIENLDLVITVDTSTLHLAGAMGKPVWLMNRFDTCWRWFLDRDDSPWYPTLRVFRQKTPENWESVVTEVKRSLEDFAKI